MEVVNDSAEREVKLITDFRNVVHNEEQQQFLLQVVENHRQQVSLNGRKEQLVIIPKIVVFGTFWRFFAYGDP
ncbi:hypothetical protein OUZ56_015926 [Daphnia magna]|uniref:Uncharacterized protein n=1 Tax=Daphnia magna TaxID=35525 RepID=A0ABR0AP56_9CRUS|nr:hypothetical protein OUZ56_015926 [Daphnia magna]